MKYETNNPVRLRRTCRTPFCDSDIGTVIESGNGESSIFCCQCGSWQYKETKVETQEDIELLDAVIEGGEEFEVVIRLAVRPSKSTSLKSIVSKLVSRLKCK